MTQKRVEYKVDEPVLKPLGKPNSQQTTLYSTQLHTFHQDPHLTPPHYSYIHVTPHPALIPFPSLHLANFYFTSVPSTSLHFTYHFPTLVLDVLYFLRTSKSVHLTSLMTFQPIVLEILDLRLTSNSLHFTPYNAVPACHQHKTSRHSDCQTVTSSSCLYSPFGIPRN